MLIKYPFISIIIINFNDNNFLKTCLDSLLKIDYPRYEIIIVDCLTVEIEKFINLNYNNSIKLIHFDYNIGPSECHNIGVNNAKGKYIVFLDNDVKVSRLWLKELIKVIFIEKNIAVAQSKILLDIDKTKFDCSGGFLDKFGFAFQRGWLELDKNQYEKVEEIFYAKGATMIVNKEIFKKINGFDKTFFFYYDETDFCWRILLSGYKILYAPKSIAFHNVGMKERFSSKRTFHYTKNHIMTLIKNYNLKNIITTVPLVYFFYLSTFIIYIKRKRRNDGFAILKGLLWNLREFKKIWAQHQYVQHLIRKKGDFYINQKMIQYPLFFYSFRKILHI